MTTTADEPTDEPPDTILVPLGIKHLLDKINNNERTDEDQQ